MRRLIALYLLFIFQYAHCQNLGEIRQDIRYAINDSTFTSHTTKYSDAILNAKINQVQKEICRFVFPIYASSLITSVTGQAEYTISSDTAKIDKVVFQITSSTGSYQKLKYSTIQSLDNTKGLTWEQLPASQPTDYYVKGNVIGLVPPPSSTYARAGGIKVYYYKIPYDMVSDTDTPYDGISYLQDYSNAIVQGVTWKCKKEKGMAWQDEFTQYTNTISNFKMDVNNSRPDTSVISVSK